MYPFDSGVGALEDVEWNPWNSICVPLQSVPCYFLCPFSAFRYGKRRSCIVMACVESLTIFHLGQNICYWQSNHVAFEFVQFAYFKLRWADIEKSFSCICLWFQMFYWKRSLEFGNWIIVWFWKVMILFWCTSNGISEKDLHLFARTSTRWN